MDRSVTSSGSSRADALEAKKRRLEELRARRNNRGKAASSNVPNTSSSSSSSSKGNLDEYIDGLLKHKAPGVIPPPVSTTSVSNESTTTTTTSSTTTSNDTSTVNTNNVVAATTTTTTNKEEVVVVVKEEEQPKKVTFTMGTQTEMEDFPETKEEEEEEEVTKDTTLKEEDETTNKDDNDDDDKKDKSTTTRLLTEEQANETLASEPFSTFFVSASKKVERLLGTPILADLLDYSSPNHSTEGGDNEDDPTNNNNNNKRTKQPCLLPSAHVEFECSKWTSTRDCTAIDWSPIHRELMLASYHTPSLMKSSGSSSSMALTSLRPQLDTPSASLLPRSGELQSDGLALIWSLAMPNRPEHIFTCASPVMNAKFHPTEHHLVVGGCQSGQLVVWDIRAGRLPVQRSSLPTLLMSELKTHAHPICAMEIIESKSGLVTGSTDGRLNFWSLSNLRDPAESFLIPNGNISSMGVAADSNSIVCGDENGNLHTIFSPNSNNTKSGTKNKAKATSSTNSSSKKSNSRRTYRTWNNNDADNDYHFGMITGLSTKQPTKTNNNTTKSYSRGFARGADGFVLTCGVDWTTKLWAPAYTDKPVLSLLSHSYDYMCDVQWSPVHPSVFATASSNGSLGIWNLATSIDEPLSGSDGIFLDPVVEEGGMTRGLNKIKWSFDGRNIAVASADKLHVLGLTEDVWKVKGDEESQMLSNLKSRGLLEDDE